MRRTTAGISLPQLCTERHPLTDRHSLHHSPLIGPKPQPAKTPQSLVVKRAYDGHTLGMAKQIARPDAHLPHKASASHISLKTAIRILAEEPYSGLRHDAATDLHTHRAIHLHPHGPVHHLRLGHICATMSHNTPITKERIATAARHTLDGNLGHRTPLPKQLLRRQLRPTSDSNSHHTQQKKGCGQSRPSTPLGAPPPSRHHRQNKTDRHTPQRKCQAVGQNNTCNHRQQNSEHRLLAEMPRYVLPAALHRFYNLPRVGITRAIL